jgi:hypothetical protein
MRHVLTQAGPFVLVYDRGSDRWSWQPLDWRTLHELCAVETKP